MKVEFCVQPVRQAAKDSEWYYAAYEEARYQFDIFTAKNPKWIKRPLEEEARYQAHVEKLGRAAWDAYREWANYMAIELATVISYYGDEDDPSENRSRTFDMLNGGLSNMSFDY